MPRRALIFLLLAAASLVPASAPSAAPGRGSMTSSTSQRISHSGRSRGIVSGASVPSRNPVSTAAAIAERYWHAVPCAGQITIVAESPLAPGLDPSTDGWVTFASSLGPDNLTAPASTYTNCTINLAHWQWPTSAGIERDWGMFCLTMIHEMGHLLGHPHSQTPGSVMAPVFTNDHNVPVACHTSWLPGQRPSGAR